MSLAHIVRTPKKNETHGVLIIGDRQFETVELKWNGNKIGVSCIPDGIYQYRRDWSTNKKREVIELFNADTNPRSQIQIHAISRTSQLKGCIGVKSKTIEKAIFNLLGEYGIIKFTTIK